MAKAPTSEKIAFTNVRGAFVKLAKAEKFKESDPDASAKFSETLLLDPSNAEHAKTIAVVKSEAKRILIQAYGDEESIPRKKLELCFGTDKDLDKVPDGYAGMFWVRLSHKPSPSVPRVPTVGRRKNSDGKFVPVQPGDKEFPYSGAYQNAKGTLWVQAGTHGRHAVNGNLLAVQFVRDGAAFGNPGADPDKEFEALEDSAEGGADDTSMFD